MDMKASVLALQFSLKLKHLKMQYFINKIIMDLTVKQFICNDGDVQMFKYLHLFHV